MTGKYHISALLGLIALIAVAACSRHSGEWQRLDAAERVMTAHPDSALAIIDSIDASALRGSRERARYALLRSMALDKNYVDTTTFDVLQPAIDYYLRHGTPDERLRTYYYQGRIYQNRHDLDSAMASLSKGIHLSQECEDSLVLARAFVAMGIVNREYYEYDGFIDNYLQAANIYKALGHREYELDCLLNALNGTILMGDKTKGDSLLAECKKFGDLDGEQARSLKGYVLAYVTAFDDENEIKDFVESGVHDTDLDISGFLNLAYAYNRIGRNQKAKNLLDSIEALGWAYDTLKHQSVAVMVYKDTGDYKNALEAYWDLNRMQDSIYSLKFDKKVKLIEDKHRIELQAQDEIRYKSRIVWGCVAGIIVLGLMVLSLLLLVKNQKTKRQLAIQRARTTELENRNLKSEKEKLTYENKCLQLDRDNKSLEAENLAHRIEILENESVSLRTLLDAPNEIPQEVQNAIQTRVVMLNSLLANYITDNDNYSKSYEAWVRDLTTDTKEFMNSNRLAFQASHPHFIKYFEEHGLTADEINYVCLYAIGLNGREVGNYMKRPSHVNTSSAIRKKLGIDKHETNIGIFVRRLMKTL